MSAAVPSNISGLCIGVTPILSTRFGKLKARIDSTSNIGKYLRIGRKESTSRTNPAVLKTNKDKLITTAVQAVVQPPGAQEYSTTSDGKPKFQ